MPKERIRTDISLTNGHSTPVLNPPVQGNLPFSQVIQLVQWVFCLLKGMLTVAAVAAAAATVQLVVLVFSTKFLCFMISASPIMGMK